MLAADADSAVQWAQRTLQLAEPAGYDEICCHALNNLGTARLIAGIDAGWDDLNRSLTLALAQGFQEHAARAYTNLAAMAVQRKQYSAGSRYLSEGLTYCERHDLDSWRFYMMAWRGRAHFEQGDWLSAAEDAQAIVAEAGNAPIARIPALTILAHLRILRGDPDVASPLNEARELAARTSEMQRLSGVALAGANAAWIAGDRQLIAQEVQPVYELASARALQGLTLELPVGQVTALVGASGGGKSTVATLLLRFERPARGRLLLDGVDADAYTAQSVRAQFALVTQEPLLFSGSVLENLRYGRPSASLDEVVAAARVAQADGFIRALPQGYQTRVGERGITLSGGQRQRLCLARAVLAGAPVLVLDEATSSLDPESEREVQAALGSVLAGRTALVIAHRLETVAGADRICVVQDGRVVEEGTHAGLRAAGGVYARLWELQHATGERGAA
jgi:ABC-type multidrug transport system fused ATPase/permease subunit